MVHINCAFYWRGWTTTSFVRSLKYQIRLFGDKIVLKEWYLLSSLKGSWNVEKESIMFTYPNYGTERNQQILDLHILSRVCHDDVIKWKHFPHYWPFVWGIHRGQRTVTRSFEVFFDLRLNKRLSKQSWGWWFETLSRPLWRHSNVKWSRPILEDVVVTMHEGMCEQQASISMPLQWRHN